ncbi:GNAT family N-acetyltransferase [Pseudolysinimonas sp.]|uniref:GNAT family N-acetyltransferase n=1 Tax=Pseudolysinimonas sp. TaxID=2680009 RepID=UPI003F801789
MDVRLRDLRPEDSEPLFALEADPRVAAMAAFGAPRTRETWPAHWALITTVPENRTWIVEADGAFAGMVCCYPMDGVLQIGYSVAPERWGRGIATAAVRALLAEVAERPLGGRVAEDNAASRRVLEKAGFRLTGREVTFAAARGEDVTELVLTLAG